MLHYPACWEDPYFRQTLNFVVEMDLHDAEKIVGALRAPGAGEARAARVRLICSTVAGYVGNRYRLRPPMVQDGTLSPAFLSWVVMNLPQGRGAVVKDLRRQLLDAAEAHGVAVPRSVGRRYYA